jgi:hypothetical protein
MPKQITVIIEVPENREIAEAFQEAIVEFAEFLISADPATLTLRVRGEE